MGIVTGVVADVILAVVACYLVYGVGWLVAALTELIADAVEWLWHRAFAGRPHQLRTEFRACGPCGRTRSCSIHPDGSWSCLTCSASHRPEVA